MMYVAVIIVVISSSKLSLPMEMVDRARFLLEIF